MKLSSFQLLIAAIIITPHLWPGVATAIALVYVGMATYHSRKGD